MSERLSTVLDYITDVRVLLLDTVFPYRYENDELVVALNTALTEGRRLRADLFLKGVPQFATVNNEPVPIEQQFRLAFVYGTVAHALMRDDEDVQDERAASFLGMGQDILIGTQRPRPPAGGARGQQGR